MKMGEKEDKIQKVRPLKDPLFTKTLPDFRPIFRLIITDFAIFPAWGGDGRLSKSGSRVGGDGMLDFKICLLCL